MTTEVAFERASYLRRQVLRHKAEIRRHKKALGTVTAELQQLEQDCAARGIKLILHNAAGEEERSSWPPHS